MRTFIDNSFFPIQKKYSVNRDSKSTNENTHKEEEKFFFSSNFVYLVAEHRQIEWFILDYGL